MTVTKDIPRLPYRSNAGAVLRRPKDGRILMCERICRERGIWQFPQGGVEAGESKEEAMWREIGEELGLEAPREMCELVGRGPEVRYDFEEYGPHYAGQAQTLFLLNFYGDSAAIDLIRHQTPEFLAWKWVTVEGSLELIMPSKRPVWTRTLLSLQDEFGVKLSE